MATEAIKASSFIPEQHLGQLRHRRITVCERELCLKLLREGAMAEQQGAAAGSVKTWNREVAKQRFFVHERQAAGTANSRVRCPLGCKTDFTTEAFAHHVRYATTAVWSSVLQSVRAGARECTSSSPCGQFNRRCSERGRVRGRAPRCGFSESHPSSSITPTLLIATGSHSPATRSVGPAGAAQPVALP